MQRMGMVLGIRPERIPEYKRLHAEVWPDFLALLSNHGITNYTIYLREPENLLFGSWEYVGSDFAADMKIMAESPLTVKWNELCMPCQQPLSTIKQGEWWAPMEEVFHLD
ncbi:MAG: L-rhamnose mutarotase [Hyphomonadaceae bacterium]